MTLSADNYLRIIKVKFHLRLGEVELALVLKLLNELNAVGYAASASYDEEANNVVVQSEVRLLAFGLVMEDDNSLDDHAGLAYAVAVAKEQSLSTARMASSAVREFEQLGWLSSQA